ncbi:hypothetical protein PLICRDRAFT_179990 [Plicaturopsis crispa FD-325 SS-3]|uniref:F-box domain-containing protein n=1 Tax=Plicaturopsis crispa FD-325 SS-3 TaxID=944288 RepID=A0A0C9SKL8_PLICR|nr:hypothetical protein PLICRDRAFT_179990 [Plicaturopsis crispa FD-325 SS-3]
MPKRSAEDIGRGLAVINGKLEILQRRNADFARIVEEMERLRDSTRAEKAALEAAARELEESKYPINWLPPELLAEMFLFYCADDDDAAEVVPYYRPPVTISHVCRKWRELSLATSALWSRISCRSARWNPEPFRVFVQRSRPSLIEYEYSMPPQGTGEETLLDLEEAHRMSTILPDMLQNMHRCRSLVIEVQTPLRIRDVLDMFNSATLDFSHLQVLDLGISEPNPSMDGPHSLLANNRLNDVDESIKAASAMSTKFSALRHLRLHQIPLFNFPSGFFSSLRTLELSFPAPASGQRNRTRNEYTLRMSTLCPFLSLTPLLEELILSDTIPLFDVRPLHTDPSRPATSNAVIRLRRPTPTVELPHLNRLEWSYPDAYYIQHFLSYILTPALEKLDLCLDDPSLKPTVSGHAAHTSGDGYHDPSGHHPSEAMQYPLLHTLSIQCVDADVLGTSLRRLSFPALESLELANVHVQAREALSADKGDPDAVVSFPDLHIALPRLESIFRDPRLPHLTALTLSHFDINPEHGRAMLAYMPALQSLSLDHCRGTAEILEALTESSVTTAKAHGQGSVLIKKGARLCPRLTALAFWGCPDLRPPELINAVQRRNTRRGDEEIRVVASGPEKVVADLTGRRIRPLRKTRPLLEAASTPNGGAPSATPSEAAYGTAPITSVRIEGCPLIEDIHRRLLEGMGVTDVCLT